MRDADAADDLVQDCLERAVRRRGHWRRDGPVKAWMFRILLNRFREQQRRRGRTLRVVGAEDTAEVARSGGQEAHMALREVHAAMGRLPDDQRAAMLLVALEGMTRAEAAAVLAVKADTLASRLACGRASLRAMAGRRGAVGAARKRKRSLPERDHIDAENLARLRHGGAGDAAELARPAIDPAIRETLDDWDRQDAALQAL